jgi:hypothetical protein
MSLHIFVSNKDSSVRILQWFCPVGIRCGESPCGPLLNYEAGEFRRVGLGFIRQHFVEHRTKMLSNGMWIPVFTTRAEKRTIGGQRVVRICESPDGRLWLMPIEVTKLSLFGLKCLPDETDQRLPMDASEEVFWNAFDKALAHSISL